MPSTADLNLSTMPMKSRKLIVALIFWPLSAFAQLQVEAVADQDTAKPETVLERVLSEPVVVEQGPHHRTWRRLISERLLDGTTVERESSYIELGTCMNVLRDDK